MNLGLWFRSDNNVGWGGGLPMGEQGDVGLGLISFKILSWVYNALGRPGSISWEITNQGLLFRNHDNDSGVRRHHSLHTTMFNIMSQGPRGFQADPQPRSLGVGVFAVLRCLICILGEKQTIQKNTQNKTERSNTALEVGVRAAPGEWGRAELAPAAPLDVLPQHLKICFISCQRKICLRRQSSVRKVLKRKLN